MVTVSAIANATRGQLLCITYEMFLYHIEEALKKAEEKRDEHLQKAGEIIKTLTEDLDFEVPLSHELFRLYVYIQGVLMESQVSDDKIKHIYQIIDIIYKGFLEVSKEEEQAPPSIQNAEQIYAGFTYGKGDLNEMRIGDKNRGFKA